MSGRDVVNFCPVCGTRLEMQERHRELRPVCPNCGHVVYFDPKVAVVVFIRQDERVLLVKRGNDPMKGWWAMPAGFIEAGEDPQLAATREVLEETSLTVEIVRLLEVFYTAHDGGIADFVIAYEAQVVSGTPQADDDAEEACWFTKDELPPVAFLPSQTLTARWVAGELG